jgi:transcriptional regulator with XRE-family HTH domain
MKALREYLDRSGITQAAFAKRVGVSQPTVSNWVRGAHSASPATLKRISRATGVPLDALLADARVPQRIRGIDSGDVG